MTRSHCPRIATVLARWMLGTALVTWRYLWETTPLHRGGECRGDETDLPPQLPPEAVDSRVQLAQNGCGRLFHRLFRVRIADADVEPGALVESVCRDFKRFVPSEVVDIHTSQLREHGLDVADGLLVEMPGPWNGPVKVVHRDVDCLHLVTLRGHMEAGQVQFRAREDDGLLVFEIELWACASTRLVRLLYSHLRLAKEIQLNMWVRFCLSAAAMSGGRPVDGVHISTRWLESPARVRPLSSAGKRSSGGAQGQEAPSGGGSGEPRLSRDRRRRDSR
ncbi:hypothetical protein D3C57_143905 [Streptomyces rapamycinicus NRRL 5491]|uniref:DUF1990 domain-containing protein n=2 Tax=Streptomyces rapamycinicus TaxID=1226757 RepID=A0A3L8QWS5_STRRN|nr:hypothetical protein D3C57_143905 [Streptomyces rapamycinicus NRRL 5491]